MNDDQLEQLYHQARRERANCPCCQDDMSHWATAHTMAASGRIGFREAFERTIDLEDAILEPELLVIWLH